MGGPQFSGFFASVQRVLFFLTPSPQPKAYCINVDTWMYRIAEQTHGYFFNIAKFMYACVVFVLSVRNLIILMLLKLTP